MNEAQKITVRMPGGGQQTFHGREAWTLRHLINAGPVGVTTLDQPAPRWSHYVFKLRKAGLVISTEHEPHTGTFPGTHGRYRLETELTLVDEVAA
jgi:hypothetical protein